MPVGGKIATAVKPTGTRPKASTTTGAFPVGKIPPPGVPGAGTPKGADPGITLGGTGADITAMAATAPATDALSRKGMLVLVVIVVVYVTGVAATSCTGQPHVTGHAGHRHVAHACRFTRKFRSASI